MASKHIRRDSSTLCVVCCEDVEFYAVGQCNHPVCYKCCVRMRVLARENYCSVCRTELETVLLTADHAPWASLKPKASKSEFDKKYGIYYATRGIRDKVKELLQHKCTICPDEKPFYSFDKLEEHMKRTHNLYYCILCVKNYTKFSHERNIYTRQELARHRRVGDADDKSHKGHPLCHFCDERFLDNDELHRHLRKNHFWCHFCEKDGKQLYYADYPNLREHFRDAHLLCEEDDCRFEQFTSVFRSEIDLQAHRAASHSQKLTKAQAKQARQVEIDITFNRQPTQSRTVTRRDYTEVHSSDRKQRRDGRARPRGQANAMSAQEEQDFHKAMETSLKTKPEKKPPSPPTTPDEPPIAPAPLQAVPKPVEIKKPNIDHFPSLPSNAPPKNTKTQDSGPRQNKNKEPRNMTTRAYRGTEEGMHPEEDFPSLGGSTGVKSSTKTKEPVPKPSKNKEPPKTTSNRKYENAAVQKPPQDDFPTLGGGTRVKPSTAPPPGFLTAARKPPPGFSQTQGTVQTNQPPPGFQVLSADTKKQQPMNVSQRQSSAPERKVSIEKSAAPAPQNTTNIVKDTKELESQNRQSRNQALIESIRVLLGNNKDKFKEFKTLSGTFRQGLCTAEEYYSECTRLFDQNFNQVFTELVDLLPDLNKREELLRVHNDAKALAKQQGKKLSKENRVKTSTAWSVQPEVPVKQVSKPVNASRNGVSLEADFPSLPAASKSKPIRAVHSGIYRPKNSVLKSAWVRGK